VARDIAARAWFRTPEEELRALEELGGRLVTLQDEDYPPLLAQVYAPPPLLYVLGDLEPCRSGGVAVVGSRKVSSYGRRVSYGLGLDLAKAGVSLVSGLALGTDTSAHKGALQGGGHTVGVLGCGIDVPYPPSNRELIREVAQKGAVISEFPLGVQPSAFNFPVRNRIISGLSRAVVVVEAAAKSGALITARHALDQGREIFAVPGPVGTPGVEGCHGLIRQGARLLDSARDILEPGALPVLLDDNRPDPVVESLPPEARKLLELIGADPVHVDTLVRESGLETQAVSALLINLELSGLISSQAGNNYTRS
jgi:DNA processing protein